MSSIAGRSGVEIENSLVVPYFRLVGMTAYNHLDTRGHGVDIDGIEIVYKIDDLATQFNQVTGRQILGPGAAVHIAPHA